MGKPLILKAVELDKCSSAFKKKYPTPQHLAYAGWLPQKKYDGCFGMAVIREGSPSQMLSRTGEDYTPACGHILEDLLAATDAQRGAGWNEVVYIGEVWHPLIPFPEISGRFRRQRLHQGAADDLPLVFVANDILPQGLTTSVPYRTRLDELRMTLDIPGVLYTKVVESVSIHNVYHEALKLQGAGGYDGVILRDPDAGYTIGLATAGQIVKVKPVLSLDLRCNGVVQGEGKHAGRLGAITVSYKGVTSSVGTGFSDKDRDLFWWHSCRGVHGDHYHQPIGKIVEVECLGITEDGRLREARFKGIRFDKEEPDA